MSFVGGGTPIEKPAEEKPQEPQKAEETVKPKQYAIEQDGMIV